MLDPTEVILIADDDPDDRLLLQEAFQEIGYKNILRFVKNGEELTNYLMCAYSDGVKPEYSRPRVILLDLNMPLKDGREALQEIKADPKFCSIPIVMLSTSRSENDVLFSYRNGASSFIVKPSTYEALVGIADVFYKYWYEVVKSPLKQ